MGIAEDIQQNKFKNSHQKAAINLIYTYNWVNEKIRCTLEKESLTNQQFNVLRILRGSYPNPLSTLQIRDRMLDKMSDTSRIVDRLIKKNLAHKSTCQSDKRLVDINISEEGLSLLSKLDKDDNSIDDLLSNLSTEDVEALNNLLDKIRA